MTKLLDWIARHLALWITGSALLTIGSMWFISANYRTPAGAEKPNAADWMQAWGSVFGVLAGLAAAGAAAFLLLHEMQRADKAERQLTEERAEAALNAPRAVAVSRALLGVRGEHREFIHHVVLNVHNYGAHPIRNVIPVVPVPEDPERQMILPPISLLGPGEKHRFERDYHGSGMPVLARWVDGERPVPSAVCFIDHTNQAWERTSEGEVRRTTVPYPLVEAARTSPDVPQPELLS
ncbi:hypothetical protein AB0J20_18235 [Micromonospora costi]|uniref:hypothetical protein n=1 Tax=Micromonospora costi TaxID=1530042 RepID=UPI0033BFDC87